MVVKALALAAVLLTFGCVGTTIVEKITPDEFSFFLDDQIDDGNLTNNRSPTRSQSFDGGRRGGVVFTYYTSKRRRFDRSSFEGGLQDFWKRGARLRVEDDEFTLRLRPEGKPDETAKLNPEHFLNDPDKPDQEKDGDQGGALGALGNALGIKPPKEKEGQAGQLIWVLTILAAVAALEAARRYFKGKNGKALLERAD